MYMSMLPHLTGFLLFSLFVLITFESIRLRKFLKCVAKMHGFIWGWWGGGVQVIARRVGGWCMEIFMFARGETPISNFGNFNM